MRRNNDYEPIGWFRILLAGALLVGCVAFIWSNSLQSMVESGLRSQAVADFLVRVIGKVLGTGHWIVQYVAKNVRKIAHAVEFFVLGGMAGMMLVVLRRVTPHMVIHAVSLVLAVAVADESIQIVTGRGAMVQDILLDFCGGIAGLAVLLVGWGVLRMLFGRSD